MHFTRGTHHHTLLLYCTNKMENEVKIYISIIFTKSYFSCSPFLLWCHAHIALLWNITQRKTINVTIEHQARFCYNDEMKWNVISCKNNGIDECEHETQSEFILNEKTKLRQRTTFILQSQCHQTTYLLFRMSFRFPV